MVRRVAVESDRDTACDAGEIDRVRAAVGVDELHFAEVNHVTVIAHSAVHRVAAAADEQVVAHTTEERVLAGACNENVVAVTTREHVVAIAAVQYHRHSNARCHADIVVAGQALIEERIHARNIRGADHDDVAVCRADERGDRNHAAPAVFVASGPLHRVTFVVRGRVVTQGISAAGENLNIVLEQFPRCRRRRVGSHVTPIQGEGNLARNWHARTDAQCRVRVHHAECWCRNTGRQSFVVGHGYGCDVAAVVGWYKLEDARVRRVGGMGNAVDFPRIRVSVGGAGVVRCCGEEDRYAFDVRPCRYRDCRHRGHVKRFEGSRFNTCLVRRRSHLERDLVLPVVVGAELEGQRYRYETVRVGQRPARRGEVRHAVLRHRPVVAVRTRRKGGWCKVNCRAFGDRRRREAVDADGDRADGHREELGRTRRRTRVVRHPQRNLILPDDPRREGEVLTDPAVLQCATQYGRGPLVRQRVRTATIGGLRDERDRRTSQNRQSRRDDAHDRGRVGG